MHRRVSLEIPVDAPTTPQDTIALAMARTPAGMTRIHSAIAYRLAQITRANFGPAGAHRPADWPRLSWPYQRAIRYFGPPKLVLEGKLIRNFGVVANREFGRVTNTTPYAAIHQHGGRNRWGRIPARPYFPVTGGGLTPYARRELIRAARRVIDQIRAEVMGRWGGAFVGGQFFRARL